MHFHWERKFEKFAKTSMQNKTNSNIFIAMNVLNVNKIIHSTLMFTECIIMTHRIAENTYKICQISDYIKCKRVSRSWENLPGMFLFSTVAQSSFPGCEREHNGPCSGRDDASSHAKGTNKDLVIWFSSLYLLIQYTQSFDCT